MSKSDPSSSKKERNKSIRWVLTIFFVTIFISAFISYVSNELMAISTVYAAFAILLVIVLIGILFDIIGVAVTSANEQPFHSMAARKVPGAQEAIKLLRKAERVSSICNDVIGDICGVVSGSASAAIAAQVVVNLHSTHAVVVSLLMSAMVAGLTVGGKALGKTFAIKSCTDIVQVVGRLIWCIKHLSNPFIKEKK